MTCPICNKPSHPVHKPFCSRRCAEVDLGRWMTDSYKLPGSSPSEDEDDAEN